MTASVYYLIFPALMIFAASYDCLARRISNLLCLFLTAAFFPAALALGLTPAAIAMHVICGLFALVAGFVLFTKGWIGGGDAKLFAAGAIWVGWSGLAGFAAITAIAGGVLALAVIALRIACAALSRSCPACIAPGAGLPYGVALAAGALVIYPQSIWALG